MVEVPHHTYYYIILIHFKKFYNIIVQEVPKYINIHIDIKTFKNKDECCALIIIL